MTFVIPSSFRKHTHGESTVEIQANTVGQGIEALVERYPGLKDQLLDPQGELVNFVNLFVNGDNIRDLQDAETALKSSDEVMIVPAMAGG